MFPIIWLDLSSMSGHLNEMPTFVSNGRDTSGYQLSNGGQIHDVRCIKFGVIVIMYFERH